MRGVAVNGIKPLLGKVPRFSFDDLKDDDDDGEDEEADGGGFSK